MKLDYATYLAHPELRRQIVAAAQRERSLAMNRLVFAPIAAFFRRPAKPAPRRATATFHTAW